MTHGNQPMHLEQLNYQLICLKWSNYGPPEMRRNPTHDGFRAQEEKMQTCVGFA